MTYHHFFLQNVVTIIMSLISYDDNKTKEIAVKTHILPIEK